MTAHERARALLASGEAARAARWPLAERAAELERVCQPASRRAAKRTGGYYPG